MIRPLRRLHRWVFPLLAAALLLLLLAALDARSTDPLTPARTATEGTP